MQETIPSAVGAALLQMASGQLWQLGSCAEPTPLRFGVGNLGG